VQETNALLSGAFGGNVYAYDIRMASKAAAWKASADVEKVAWNTYNPAYFAVIFSFFLKSMKCFKLFKFNKNSFFPFKRFPLKMDL